MVLVLVVLGVLVVPAPFARLAPAAPFAQALSHPQHKHL